MSVWVLLWVTGTNDFIIKFSTVAVKALVALAPRNLLNNKRKVAYTYNRTSVPNEVLFSERSRGTGELFMGSVRCRASRAAIKFVEPC